MRAIEVSDIGTAWEESVRHVLRKGVPVTTEDNEETLETDELMVKVLNPLRRINHPKNLSYGEAYLLQYSHDLVCGGENDDMFDYTYHKRLFYYRQGRGLPFSQIYYATRTLELAQSSRRGICMTWDVLGDSARQNVPCLQWIQFLIRDNKLNMKVLFRSNDILMAMYANMYALIALQAHVAAELSIPVGTYTHIVTVPHIYHKRDANEVEKWS